MTNVRARIGNGVSNAIRSRVDAHVSSWSQVLAVRMWGRVQDILLRMELGHIADVRKRTRS